MGRMSDLDVATNGLARHIEDRLRQHRDCLALYHAEGDGPGRPRTARVRELEAAIHELKWAQKILTGEATP